MSCGHDLFTEVKYDNSGTNITTVDLSNGRVRIVTDTTLTDLNKLMIKYVSNNINIPLIASGGASSFEDFKIAIQNGASAVAAASMFHFTYRTPNEAKEFLLNKGIPIRQPLKS